MKQKSLIFIGLLIVLIINIFAEMPTGADYLIICPDAYVDEFEEFAEWKTKKGILTRIVPLSETGSSTSDIDTYIEDAYSTWVPSPRYVLIGARTSEINMVYAGNTSYGACYSDWGYGDVGGDLYQEIMVGRFPAVDAADITDMCDKSLSYERTPTSGNWLAKGCCATRYDGDDSDADYSSNMDTLQAAMDDAGYVEIDDFASYEYDDTDVLGDANDVEAAVNEGRGVLAYRGQGTTNWWSPFQISPSDMTNAGMPFITLSITCHTIYDGTGTSTELGEALMRKTNSGTVAFYGTSSTISDGSEERGEVFEAMARSMYADTTNDIGRAAEAGRRRVWEMFSDEVQNKSHILLGDPELDIRTGVPSSLSVSHPSEAYAGESNSFSVNAGVSGALVCIKLEEDVYMRETTNAFGVAEFTFTPNILGTMSVTVTAKNYYPYEGTCEIIPNGPFPLYSSVNIVDNIIGNNDGELNPGENVDMYITLENIGNSSLDDGNATLTTSDPYVTISTATASFPNIPESGTGESSTSFEFEISETCPKNHIIEFELDITDGSSNSWNLTEPELPVNQPDIIYVAHSVDDSAPYGDGDGTLETGESAKIQVTLQNSGSSALGETDIIANPIHENLAFDDPLTEFLTWPAGVSKDNDTDPFWASLAPFPVTTSDASFRLLIEGDGQTYTFYDTLELEIPIAGSGSGSTASGFTGPDDYGYYCYDDTDVETGQAPVYDWMDISSLGTRLPLVSSRDDYIRTYSFPHFDIVYYGITEDELSFSTNGFVAVGEEDWSGGSGVHEQPIPSTGEADAILGAFWDDLDPSRNGDIYGYMDSDNDRYIIQYDDVTHFDADDLHETFQIIIHDPAYWPSPTGDCDIIFQYHTVSDMDYQATGIENFTGTDGIQYCYRIGMSGPEYGYDENAEEIVPGRAIRFTTNPPISDDVWIVVNSQRITENPPDGNGNDAAEEGETISLYLTLKNEGTIEANSVQANITSSDPYISVIDGSSDYGTIAADASVENSSDPYTFSVSGLSSPDHANFDLTISANSGDYERTTVVQVPVWVVLDITESPIPDKKQIASVYPNPFNSNANIEFDLPDASNIKLSVFDLTGKEIYSVFGYFNSGKQSIDLDFEGNESGIYFYKLQTDKNIQTGKLILMK
ncbi:MAG: C25 family cysteine peptidase [Candidatus Zixiibacteriota bacterium]